MKMLIINTPNLNPKAVRLISCGILLGTSMVLAAQTTALAHGNKVSITSNGGQRCIVSNGLPDHATGQFPTRGNPNTISAQNINLCVSANPRKGKKARFFRGSVGVGLNGVQFRPGTAEYYDSSSPRGFSRDRKSGWHVEGMGARDQLGMDQNNAHVDERGLYHYHGVASALVKSGKGSLIGYAADGCEIHYAGNRQKASYQLKSGNRKSGPGGKHDGTYVEDWQYVANSGSLDQCNGGMLNGKFVYFATKTYPFFPRCMWGAVSSDFTLGRPQRTNSNGLALNRKRPRARSANGRQPPREAITACKSAENNSQCSFNAPNGRQVRGLCLTTPANVVACVPRR